MAPRADTRLALFFTRGVSLATWQRNGSLERELAPYRALAGRLDEVAFLTYGGAEERALREHVRPIRLYANERRLPPLLYELLLPVLQAPALRRATVLKTNQLTGGRAALRAKRIFGLPLIVRCGYLRTEVEPAGSARHLLARLLERTLFTAADLVVVTTARIREVVRREYGVAAERVHVVPNPVDVDLFRPPEPPHDCRRRGVLFVGRLAPEKNVDVLLDAVAGLDGLPVRIVGTGPLEQVLRGRARRLGLEAEFLGSVPNEQLPALFREAAAFVLPSRFEGHPKALIEAMACGTPVVGADVRGIREVVADGETGLLAPPEASSLRAAVEALLADEGRAAALGRRAREAVSSRYSLERVVELELDALEAAEAARCRA